MNGKSTALRSWRPARPSGTTNFPWTMGFNVNYQSEGKLYGLLDIPEDQAEREDRRASTRTTTTARTTSRLQGRPRRQGEDHDRGEQTARSPPDPTIDSQIVSSQRARAPTPSQHHHAKALAPRRSARWPRSAGSRCNLPEPGFGVGRPRCSSRFGQDGSAFDPRMQYTKGSDRSGPGRTTRR
jgi:hypothetical protein